MAASIRSHSMSPQNDSHPQVLVARHFNVIALIMSGAPISFGSLEDGCQIGCNRIVFYCFTFTVGLNRGRRAHKTCASKPTHSSARSYKNLGCAPAPPQKPPAASPTRAARQYWLHYGSACPRPLSSAPGSALSVRTAEPCMSRNLPVLANRRGSTSVAVSETGLCLI